MKVKKGKTAGKICPNEWSCLQIYVVLWVSLYINQRRWGDSSNVTPLGLCVCLSVYVLHRTFILHPRAAHVSSKAN